MSHAARSLLVAMVLAWTALPLSAQEFYRGRTIELIVSVAAGGGYDQYARALARVMGRHIPGNPQIVVQNMPGAGGLRAANLLYSVARKDGTVFGTIVRELAIAPLLEPGSASAQFKADRFNWIGSPQQELGLVIVNSKLGIHRFEQLVGREVTVSSSGAGSSSTIFSRALNAVFGTRLKSIEGYPGSMEALMAVEIGETDGHVTGGSSAAFRGRINPWLEKGQVKVLLQLAMTKDKAYPNAPLVFELIQAEADRQLFELLFTPQVIGRPFLAPPEVPKDRVELLRQAFDATMKDPDFLADAAKQQMEINPVGGAEINTLLARIYAMPPVLIERARTIVK